jgi:hypothetical protein
MSMSMNLHTKIAENFEVKAKLTTADFILVKNIQ